MPWASWACAWWRWSSCAQEDPALAQTVVVLGGAAALLGWAIIPVVASAADMTLDPARFTTFAVPMPQLLAGLALGGLIGIPGLATALVALATVGTWSRGLLPRRARWLVPSWAC